VVVVKAYHLKWQELPLDANIKKWSVHVLNLDRHKRHLDRATLNQFWEILDRLVSFTCDGCLEVRGEIIRTVLCCIVY